ncbi:ABC transporter ATP-binding protein [Paracoccus sp. S-4012]|uniref:ABC transporter ATP-binding protein n=1 Tax=Paracoccus sp. S-4012 TaxID=2665648 RepID=UPI0018A1BF81|nr:ABC transporter ATP-binding protein [Paracoccus sp. S-4012]
MTADLAEPAARPAGLSADPILALEHVTVRFGGLVANDDVSLTLGERRSLALMGPNGAGKTTLFNVVAGSVRPTSGRVVFAGQDITTAPASERSRLGIARTFQITQPFSTLTVRENVMVALTAAGASMKDAHARARDYVDFVGLGLKLDDPSSTLSTGQRKRLELARALATRPRLLMLDEVTGGVDRPSIPGIIDTIHRLRDERGITLIVVEHHMDFLRALADEALFLHRGQVVVGGPIETVAAHPTVRNIYLGDADD